MTVTAANCGGSTKTHGTCVKANHSAHKHKFSADCTHNYKFHPWKHATSTK